MPCCCPEFDEIVTALDERMAEVEALVARLAHGAGTSGTTARTLTTYFLGEVRGAAGTHDG